MQKPDDYKNQVIRHFCQAPRIRRMLLIAGALTCILPTQSEAVEDQPVSVEEFLQALSSVPRVLDRRDPFEQAKPSYLKEDKKESEIVEARAEVATEELPPAERFNITQYVVKAVLLGDKSPRALVAAPDGTMLIVNQSSRLGNKNGEVERIDRAGVQVVEKIKNNFGSFENVIQVLPVGGFTQ